MNGDEMRFRRYCSCHSSEVLQLCGTLICLTWRAPILILPNQAKIVLPDYSLALNLKYCYQVLMYCT